MASYFDDDDDELAITEHPSVSQPDDQSSDHVNDQSQLVDEQPVDPTSNPSNNLPSHGSFDSVPSRHSDDPTSHTSNHNSNHSSPKQTFANNQMLFGDLGSINQTLVLSSPSHSINHFDGLATGGSAFDEPDEDELIEHQQRLSISTPVHRPVSLSASHSFSQSNNQPTDEFDHPSIDQLSSTWPAVSLSNTLDHPSLDHLNIQSEDVKDNSRDQSSDYSNSHSDEHSNNQSSDQSNNQSNSQSNNQSNEHSANHSDDECENEFDPSISHSVNQLPQYDLSIKVPLTVTPPRSSTSISHSFLDQSITQSTTHSRQQSLSSRSLLPLSSSFLLSLANAPPLCPVYEVERSSDQSNNQSNNQSSLVPCPCQTDADAANSALSPSHRRVSMTPSKSNQASKQTSKQTINQSIPPSIQQILQSIDVATSQPHSPLTPVHQSINQLPPASLERVVDYLECLCHHLQLAKAQFYRSVQVAKHAQMCSEDDPRLGDLEAKNGELIDALKLAAAKEVDIRSRIATQKLALEQAKKQTNLLGTFASLISTRSQEDTVNRGKLDHDVSVRSLEALHIHRSNIQAQMMCLGTITQECRTDGAKRSYTTLIEAVNSCHFLTAMGPDRVNEWRAQIETWLIWKRKGQVDQQHMTSVAITLHEIRARCDEFVIMHWR